MHLTIHNSINKLKLFMWSQTIFFVPPMFDGQHNKQSKNDIQNPLAGFSCTKLLRATRNGTAYMEKEDSWIECWYLILQLPQPNTATVSGLCFNSVEFSTKICSFFLTYQETIRSFYLSQKIIGHHYILSCDMKC